MLLTSFVEFIDCALDVVTPAAELRVASYNWAYYAPTNSSVSEFTRAISRAQTKVIIGAGSRECTPGCVACQTANATKVQGLYALRERMRPAEVKVVDDLHLKLVCSPKYTIIGGINMTGSGWVDAAVRVKTTKAILQLFDNAWVSTTVKPLESVKTPLKVVDPLQWVFTFGKYKGKTIAEVAQISPTYTAWCRKNVTWFEAAVFGAGSSTPQTPPEKDDVL